MEQRDSAKIRVSVSMILLFQVSALFVRSFTQQKMVGAGIDPAQAKNLSALVGFAMLAFLMWPVLLQTWPSIRPMYRPPSSWHRMALASIAVGVLLWLANSLVLLAYGTREWIAQPGFSQTATFDYLFDCLNPTYLLLAIPVMSLLTPVVEETINRGLILHRFLPRGKWLAIFVSASLFAVLHAFKTYPSAFVFGIIAAVQTLNYRTLWAALITHSTFNLLAEIDRHCLYGYWVPGKITWEPGGTAQLITLSIVACLVGTCWLVRTGQSRLVDRGWLIEAGRSRLVGRKKSKTGADLSNVRPGYSDQSESGEGQRHSLDNVRRSRDQTLVHCNEVITECASILHTTVIVAAGFSTASDAAEFFHFKFTHNINLHVDFSLFGGCSMQAAIVSLFCEP